jgi:hypothetical protein
MSILQDEAEVVWGDLEFPTFEVHSKLTMADGAMKEALRAYTTPIIKARNNIITNYTITNSQAFILPHLLASSWLTRI